MDPLYCYFMCWMLLPGRDFTMYIHRHAEQRSGELISKTIQM